MSHIRDTSWLRASFLTAGLNHNDRARYQKGKGWMKFTDTTLGGNTAINAPYQFTRFADIKERRLLPDVGRGMGRWYSQNIDDWGHNVHFRMGVPVYSGVLPFAIKAINGPAARYVATGREPGMMSKLGQIGGYIISAAFWEITLLSFFISTVINLTYSRFYYLKPTMYQYWRTVQTILDTLSGNLGLTLNSLPSDDRSAKNVAGMGNSNTDKALIESARRQLPETFRTPVIGSGMQSMGVDAHAVASRAQGLQLQHQQELLERMSRLDNQNLSPEQIASHLEQAMAGGVIARGNVGQLKPSMHNATLEAYHKHMSNSSMYGEPTGNEGSGKSYLEAINESLSGGGGQATGESFIGNWFSKTVDSFETAFGVNEAGKTSKSSDMLSKLIAELRDGSQWCSFRVTNATESVGESVSNSSEKSDIANIFNQMSQTSRGVTYNLAGGKTGIGLVDDVIGGVTGAVGDALVSAAATSVHFLNPVIGLLYGAQIDMPKRWGNSQTNLSSTTFKIELRCGYGNVVSYYQDILFPLAMLLAMALPRGTGSQSYGSPFYVQYYSKGRSQVKVGLVSSLSITRGVGNAPWHKRGWPMGVDVSVTVEDMTEMMFSPVDSNLRIEGIGGGIFGSPIDENAMGDYLAVLSALGMNEQEYFIPIMKRKLNTMISEFNGWLSPHRWAGAFRDTAIGEIASAFSQQTTVRN